jgi:hypothetical protein
MTNVERMTNDETPAYKPPRLWAYLVGVVVFQILNALYWAFVGGLGWGFGSAVGSYVPWAGAEVLGGAAGVALVLFGILTINPAGTPPAGFSYQRSEYTPIQLAPFGAVAAACASLALLFSLGRDLTILLGVVAGFVVGILTAIIKQYFAPVAILPACVIAVTGATLFVGVGALVDGPLGWAAAGSMALFGSAMLAEWWRREPAVEIDAQEQPVRVIPRGEMIRYTAVQSWHPTGPVAWGWHGWFAGLFAALWAQWAADHPNRDAVRQPFLVCGGLAAFVIVTTRLGIVKQPEKAKDEGAKTKE